MAPRKTARNAKQTQRYGVDIEEGQEVNPPVTGTSTTTLKKGKSKVVKKKQVKRQRYSEEATSYDDSASDTDSSRGHARPGRRKASYSRKRAYISVKPPTWDGQKESWPEFEEQFRLFLNDVDPSWDIETTVFSEQDDKDIYSWLMRAEKATTTASTAYNVMYPQCIDQGQAGFRALRQYCLGTQQAMLNTNLQKMVNYRLLSTMNVLDWGTEMKRVEAQLMKFGVIPKPRVGLPSVIVAFHMSFMPPKFKGLMSIIRQRKGEPLPNLPDFIDLLLAEEEAEAARSSQGVSMKQPGAPSVQEVGSFTAPPSGARGRNRQKPRQRRGRGRGRGGGGGGGGSAWSSNTQRPGPVEPGRKAAAAAAAATATPPPHPPATDYSYPSWGGGRGRGGNGNFRGYRGNNRGRGSAPYSNGYDRPAKYCINHRSTSHNTNECWGTGSSYNNKF